jgi:hypothetical protein
VLVVDPPKPVLVEQSDGVWQGWLSAWRRTDSGWRAFVTYRRGPGMTHVHWVAAGDVALARGADAVHDFVPGC